MEWVNNFTLSHLILSHDVTIEYGNLRYVVRIPSLKELLSTTFYNKFIHLFDLERMEQWRQLKPDLDKGDLLQMLMTEPRITNLKEFSPISTMLHEDIRLILPEFKINERQLFSGDSPIIDEALTEILYILQLGIGWKPEAPQHFGPDEQDAKRFYERAQLAKQKAKKIREENSSNKDGIMDMFTLIAYRFPMYTFEQLYDMTLYQLHYLQQTVANMLGYEHGMTAYLAGNLKKPPKFFLS